MVGYLETLLWDSRGNYLEKDQLKSQKNKELKEQ